MPLTWNGVTFSEACPDSPEFSVLPLAESRMNMTGWFNWDDITAQAATKAYCGYAQTLTGWANVPNFLLQPPAGRPYFSYVNPLAHPDWPNQMFLCDGFDRVKGFTANKPAIGPNNVNTYREGAVNLHFRSPKDGYRTLPDTAVVDYANGGGSLLPREWCCARNMEIVEQMTSKAQTIPANAGLQWVVTAGVPGQNVSAANNFTVYEGDITIKWYPVPITGFNVLAANDLIGKTNSGSFPLACLPPPPAQPVLSLLDRKPPGTLVWGQPSKKYVRMGDTGWAYEITLRLKYFPYGANAFFWWNPPAGVKGRLRINPGNPVNGAPVADPALGGPGYYPVRRTDGTQLFPSQDYKAAFLPTGADQ